LRIRSGTRFRSFAVRLRYALSSRREIYRLQDEVRSLKALLQLQIRLGVLDSRGAEELKNAMKLGPQCALTLDGSLVLFPSTDTVMAPSIRTAGEWEPAEANWILMNSAPGVKILNVGANVGYFAIRLRSHYSEFFAIEPSQHICHFLRANVHVNELIGVNVLQYAASDYEGVGLLETSSWNTGDNRMVAKAGFATEEVRVIPMSKLIDLTKIGFAIIDVQGYEPQVLRGLASGTSRPTFPMILEYEPDAILAAGGDPLTYLNQISELGYEMELISPSVNGRLSPDAIFELAKKNGWNTISIGAVHRSN
jgi:FkbM family methyltransferase